MGMRVQWAIPVIVSVLIGGLALLPEVGIASCSGVDCANLAKIHADRAERFLEDISPRGLLGTNICSGAVEQGLLKRSTDGLVFLISFPNGDQSGSLKTIDFVDCADGRGSVIVRAQTQITICNTL